MTNFVKIQNKDFYVSTIINGKDKDYVVFPCYQEDDKQVLVNPLVDERKPNAYVVCSMDKRTGGLKSLSTKRSEEEAESYAKEIAYDEIWAEAG